MTDIAGIVTGILGLINDSFDLHDRWGSVKNFQNEFTQCIRAWKHGEIRRAMWIEYTGFDGQRLKDQHHPRLDDKDVYSGAKDCFETIREICVWLEKKTSKLKISSDQTEELQGKIGNLSMDKSSKIGGPAKSCGSSAARMREGTGWALHGKQFKDEVERLEKAVDRLYDLVPVDSNTAAGTSSLQGGMFLISIRGVVVKVTKA